MTANDENKGPITNSRVRRTAVIRLVVTHEERKAIALAAASERRTVADYVRFLALQSAQGLKEAA